MLAALAAYQRALAGREHLICYAMKANSSLAVLQTFAQAGCGFDIVSGGELERVLAAGGEPPRSCSPASARPAPRCGARSRPACCASTSRARPNSRCCRRSRSRSGRRAPVSLRVNPDVDAAHPPLHLHRPEGQQVRHRARRRRSPPTCAPPRCPAWRWRHRLPHRLADHRDRALPRRARPRARPGRARRSARASRCTTSTSAAAWASPTPTNAAFGRRAGARPAGAHRRSAATATGACCSSPAARSSATPACC